MKRSPRSQSELFRYLDYWFSRVQSWLDHPAGLDVSELADCAEVVRDASRHVRRFGGGEVVVSPRPRMHHNEAMSALGRMRTWCLASLRDEATVLTTTAAARQLKVSPDKVRAWIGSGELMATNVAAKGRARPRYRIDRAELLEFQKRRSNVVKSMQRLSRRRKPFARDPYGLKSQS